MNSLSWFLYFADVVTNFGITIVILTLLFGSGFFIFSVFQYVDKSDSKFFKWNLLTVFLLLFASIIPSKNTMYAIAASEIGEEVAKSDIGKKSLKAIEQWIDAQINKK
jgi:hypothetical protein